MRVFRPLAHFAYRRRWPLLGLLVVLLTVGSAYSIGTADVLVSGGFDDPGSESAHTAEILADTFDMGAPEVMVAYSHPSAEVGDRAFRDALQPVLRTLERRPEVTRLTSPYANPPSALVSDDGHVVLVGISLRGGAAAQDDFARIEPLLRASGLTTNVGGSLPSSLQAQAAAEHDLVRGEIIAFPLVALLLVLFFRSALLALFPLLVGGLAVAGALSCLRLLSHVTEVSVFAMNIVTFLGLGVAIDYALFMTSRYRDELDSGCDVATAVERTVVTAGRTISYSGVAVAASLAGLLVFPLKLLQSIAIGGIAVVLLVLLASLLFVPAGLAALGAHIDWLSFSWGKKRRREEEGRVGYWERLAGAVTRRPLLVTCATTVVLLFLGAPFLRMEEAVGGAALLPAEAEARQVIDLLGSGRFPANATTPVLTVLRLDEPAASASGRTTVGRFADAVFALPGVVAVDSIAGPRDRREPPPTRVALSPLQQRAQARALIAGNLTVVRIITDHAPDTATSRRLVEAIRALSVRGVHQLVGGQAAHIADVRTAVTSNLPLATALICAATFVVLFLAFGSVVMPLKAIVMNALSLSAAFGALVWIFQDGRFERLLDYRSTGSIDLILPVVLFSVLFGLAMDYELFLLSRIREAYDETADGRKSVSVGLQQTGRVITRAAVLLVTVMLGFITADMALVKQIGVGVTIAILVDVTLVRALLVPATMALLGRYNWWAPRFLVRAWRGLGAGVDERTPAPHG